MSFLFIITGYNCVDYVRGCYESIRAQDSIWRAVFVDDNSGDTTFFHLLELIEDHRINIVSNGTHMGAAHNRYSAIKEFGKPGDIVVLLDMDDAMLPGALDRISEEYKNGVYMTYGTYVDSAGFVFKDLHFDEETHRDRDYRKVRYRSTAPKTFRIELFDGFSEEDFMVDGKWIQATTESPLMFGLLEMCGKDKIGVIESPIYYYNKDRSVSAKEHYGKGYQEMVYNDIINRPKKALYEGTLDKL